MPIIITDVNGDHVGKLDAPSQTESYCELLLKHYSEELSESGYSLTYIENFSRYNGPKVHYSLPDLINNLRM